MTFEEWWASDFKDANTDEGRARQAWEAGRASAVSLIAAWVREHGDDDALKREQLVDAGGWNTSTDVLDEDKLADALNEIELDPGLWRDIP